MAASTLAVLGAGSWGTALSLLAAGNGHRVRLWTREPEQLASMLSSHSNAAFLPGITFPDGIEPVGSLAAALDGAAEIIIAIPSHGFRALLEKIAGLDNGISRLAWATKGFESPGGKLLHEVTGEVFGTALPSAVISGPSFANEVAQGLPAAVAVASADAAFADDLCALLHGGAFRAYANNDIVGVQIGGAVKNVLAIAVGISDGLGYGANARAALITRGLAEMSRFGAALGARPETFTGLAGLGDLVLTCTDDQSRNRRLGLALAGGASVESAQAEIGQVVEGIPTATLVMERAAAVAVEMPIAEQVYAVLAGRCTPADAVMHLLARTLRREQE